jgi:hypothetical protein
MAARISHTPLVDLARDVTQLVDPIRHTRHRHPHHWDRNRNRKPCTCPTETVVYPPLLDQLRDAILPGISAVHGPERRRVPDSKPPLNVDALDRFLVISMQIVAWHNRLGGPPNPARGAKWPKWQKAALRQFVGLAPHLAPSIADDLAADVHRWRHWAATQAGWRLEDLE